MSYSYEPYERHGALTAAQSPANERLGFIRRTYGHLAGAILLFIILEMLLFMFVAPTQEAALKIVGPLMGWGWLLVLGGFILVGWLARSWAHSTSSRAMQYAGLGLYVVLWTAMFFPMLCLAVYFVQDYTVIPKAGLLTLLVFAGLTAGVFITGKDFSFLGPILTVGGFLILGAIIVGVFMGGFGAFSFWFALGMVGFASAAILYDTSNVLHHFRTDQHVAAALELFASVALLFWYVLQIFMLSRD